MIEMNPTDEHREQAREDRVAITGRVVNINAHGEPTRARLREIEASVSNGYELEYGELGWPKALQSQLRDLHFLLTFFRSDDSVKESPAPKEQFEAWLNNYWPDWRKGSRDYVELMRAAWTAATRLTNFNELALKGAIAYTVELEHRLETSAALSSRDAEKWHPISTAPKDGEWQLVGRFDSEGKMVWWLRAQWHLKRSYWRTSGGGCEPTHWMAVPTRLSPNSTVSAQDAEVKQVLERLQHLPPSDPPCWCWVKWTTGEHDERCKETQALYSKLQAPELQKENEPH